MKARILIAVVAVLTEVCLVVASSEAQDNPDDVYWDNSVAITDGGLNGAVMAMTVYDGTLIVTGEFTTAGGIPANHIAAWDGQSWSALGTGTGSVCYAMIEHDGNLVASTYEGVFVWDGSNWSLFDSNRSSAIAVWNGVFFAAFNDVSGGKVASWDGIQWSTIGTTEADYSWVCPRGISSLAVFGDYLYASGYFQQLQELTPTPGIAMWDGKEWSAVGSGLIDGQVDGIPECPSMAVVGRLLVSGGNLIAGGLFRVSESESLNPNIASWNGTSWTALGYGMDAYSSVPALAIYEGHIVAGGHFSTVGGRAVNNIAVLVGSTWMPLGSGIESNRFVTSLAAFDGKLFVAGDFFFAGGKFSPYLAVWTARIDRRSWHVAVNGSDKTGDGSEQYPFATIQHAIELAPSQDTVLVHPGTYTGPGNRDIHFHGKDILLMSVNGPEETIIDCQGTQSELHRGFWFHRGETNDARVVGFTITNGYAPEDDTVLSDLGTLVYAHGGGIFCDSASGPTIKACRIVNNHALWKGYGSGGDGGGGIYCYKSSPVLEDNVISGNTSGNGGGVALSQSSAHLIRNLIADNHSSHEAGGVALLGSTDVLESNTISGNTAVVGGGVWLNGSSPTMARCVIAFNSGGSFVCSGSSNLPVLTYCDIYESGISSWPTCISGQLGQNGNFSLDPMFCDAANGDYHLSGYSPCAPANNYWDGTLIGALEPACNNLLCGDANMDGQLTSADVELLQAYYFFQTPPDIYVPVGAADMDCNDRISLNDLIMLAGYLYGFGPVPCCAPPPKRLDLPVLDHSPGGPTQ